MYFYLCMFANCFIYYKSCSILFFHLEIGTVFAIISNISVCYQQHLAEIQLDWSNYFCWWVSFLIKSSMKFNHFSFHLQCTFRANNQTMLCGLRKSLCWIQGPFNTIDSRGKSFVGPFSFVRFLRTWSTKPKYGKDKCCNYDYSFRKQGNEASLFDGIEKCWLLWCREMCAVW